MTAHALSSKMEAEWRKRLSTLNIKNFPDELYERLQERARARHRSVAQEAIHILSEAVETPEPRSLLELRGLGREAWDEVEPAAHVARERDSWD